MLIQAKPGSVLGVADLMWKTNLLNTLTSESEARRTPSSFQFPIRAGASVGGPHSTATAGLVVTPQSNPGMSYLLVNAHIIVGMGADGKLYGPGLKDRKSKTRVVIGEVERFASLDGVGPFQMDAALVSVHNAGAVDPFHPLVGYLRGHFSRVQKGWRLIKLSRTSGASSGVVVKVGWRGFVRYPDCERLFVNQIVIHNPYERIALAGDSGAVWLSEDSVAVAMAFSGSKDGHFAFATPISAILDAFGVVVGTRSS